MEVKDNKPMTEKDLPERKGKGPNKMPKQRMKKFDKEDFDSILTGHYNKHSMKKIDPVSGQSGRYRPRPKPKVEAEE